MKKVLIVANLDKEHIMKFHLSFMQQLQFENWEVHVACAGNTEIPFCNVRWHIPFKRNPFSLNTLKGTLQLAKIISSNKFDIVHCHTATGGVAARIANIISLNKSTIIYTAHGFHFFKGSSLISWLVYFPLEYILSFFTDYLVTINKEDNKLTDKLKMAKFRRYIPGIGVSTDKYTHVNSRMEKLELREQLRLPLNSILIGYTAELTKNKNQKLLIDSIKILLQNKTNVYLVLIGPDYLNGKLEKYALKNGVSGKIMFLGWRDDVPKILKSLDYYIASSFREGFGINIIEAMASGLPVIAVKNRGHIDIVNESNGILVNYEAKEVARALMFIDQNLRLKRNIIKNGLIDIKKYDCVNINNQLLELYNEAQQSTKKLRGKL